MSSFLTEIKGFTPIIDVLADELGLVPAAIYGAVWRYCQMQNGVCYASLQTLADKLKLNRRTVERHIKSLCESGYLEDTTPSLKGIPHTYRDTGRIKIMGLVTTEIGATESTNPYDREYQPPTTESTIKRLLEDTESRGAAVASTPPPAKKKPTPLAVRVFREKAHRYPSKSWYGEIDSVVGEKKEDLERWGDVVFNYVGMGWNPTNVKGMLEFYQRGDVPGEGSKSENETIETLSDGRRKIRMRM